MAAVCGQCLFAIFSKGHQNRSVLNGKKDGALASGFVQMFVVGPTGDHEHVAFLPFKASACDHGRAASLKHVINGTVHLAVGLGMDSRANHLDPGSHGLHDRPAGMRIRVLQGNVVERAGIDLGQIIEGALGGLPLVGEKRRVIVGKALPRRAGVGRLHISVPIRRSPPLLPGPATRLGRKRRHPDNW